MKLDSEHIIIVSEEEGVTVADAAPLFIEYKFSEVYRTIDGKILPERMVDGHA